MIDSVKINETIQQVFEAMPEGLKNLPEELKQQLKGVLSSVLSSMDLVTREEFDIQQGVLEKTRHKVDELEKLVSEMTHK